MALEYPNRLEAGAVVDGNQDLGPDPFLKNNGFQAFDPASNPADFETIFGGWTKLGDGEYIMRLLSGIDLLEASVVVSPAFGTQELYSGFMLPAIPELGQLGDGTALLITIFDVVLSENIDQIYDVLVWRLATGGLTIAELAPPGP